MAEIVENIDSDIQKIKQLQTEIEHTKKTIVSLNSPQSGTSRTLESSLQSLMGEYRLLSKKVSDVEGQIIISAKQASEAHRRQQTEIDALIRKYEVLNSMVRNTPSAVTPGPARTYGGDAINEALATQVKSVEAARKQLDILQFAVTQANGKEENALQTKDRLNRKIQENTDFLKLNSDAFVKQKMEIEDYEVSVKRSLEGTRQFSFSLSKMLGMIGNVDALKQFASEIVRVRGQFQQFETNFTTMLQSKEKADRLMSDVVDIAVKSPFDLQSVAASAKQMLIAGTDADSIGLELGMLGDVAAGVGIELDHVTSVYSALRTQERAYTADVQQFAGCGIPIYEALGRVLGVATGEVAGWVEAGKVGFTEVEQAFRHMTSETGLYHNMMEEQSKSLTGQIDNLGDAWNIMLNEIGEDSEGIASITLSAATSMIQNYEKIGKALLSVAAVYGSYKAAVIALNITENIRYQSALAHMAGMTRMQAVMEVLRAKTIALNTSMLANPFVLVTMAIVGLIAATVSYSKSCTALHDELERVNNREKEQRDLLEQRRGTIEALIATIQDENQIEVEKLEALDKLKSLMPSVFSQYETEKELIEHLKEARQAYNEELRKEKTLKGMANMEEDQRRLSALKRYKELLEKQRKSGLVSLSPDEKVEFKTLREKYHAEVSTARGTFQPYMEALSLLIKGAQASVFKSIDAVRTDVQSRWAVSVRSMNQDTAQIMAQHYANLLKLAQDTGKKWVQVQGEAVPVSTEMLEKRILMLRNRITSLKEDAPQNRHTASIAWENALKKVDEIKANQHKYSKEGYKDALEKAQEDVKAAEQKYKDFGGTTNLPSPKPGPAIPQEDKQQLLFMQDTYGAEYMQMKTDLAYQEKQAGINALNDGYEKTKRQRDLNHEKELQELEQRKTIYVAKAIQYEKELFEVQEKIQAMDVKDYQPKTFDESSVQIDTSMFDTIKEEIEKKHLKEDTEAILKEYATFTQKSLDIKQKYEEDLKALRAAGGTKEQENLLNKRMQKEQEDLDNEFVRSEDDFEAWSERIGTLTKKEIKQRISEAQSLLAGDEQQDIYVAPEDLARARVQLKSYQAQLDKMQLSPEETKKKQWEEFQQLIVGVGRSFKEMGGIFGGVFAQLGAHFDQLSTATLGVWSSIEDTKEAMKAEDMLGAAMGGMATFQAGLQAIGVVTKLVTGKSKEQEDRERLEAVTNRIAESEKVVNAFIKARIGLIREATSAEREFLMGTTTQAVDNQLAFYEKQLGRLSGNDILAKKGKNNNLSLKELGIGSLEQLKEFMESSALQDYLQNKGYGLRDADKWFELVGAYEELIEKKKELDVLNNELLTGMSLDEAQKALDDLVTSADTTFGDISDSFEDHMRNAVLNMVKSDFINKEMETWYKTFSEYAQDGLTDTETENLYTMYQGTYETARQMYEELLSKAGIGIESGSSGQSASSRAFGTEMTQEQGGEISGRLTAVAESNYRIEAVGQQQALAITELKGSVSELAANARELYALSGETRNILAQSYLELQHISENTGVSAKYLKDIKNEMVEVKRNTAGLSSR